MAINNKEEPRLEFIKRKAQIIALASELHNACSKVTFECAKIVGDGDGSDREDISYKRLELLFGQMDMLIADIKEIKPELEKLRK